MSRAGMHGVGMSRFTLTPRPSLARGRGETGAVFDAAPL
ncbi:MAG: hypothetical protein KatS3mg058_3050 [Roseiflexus sp.]|nr:MAG: hypothetical protein KatS3mg058_3050 [Roseiflexus sp.]